MLKRTLRLLLFSLLGLTVLVGGAVVSLEQHLNSSGFKAELEELLTSELGRPVHIDGRLKIRLFPAIGLQVSSLFIPQLEGYGDDPLLSVDSASLSLSLLPLVSGRLEFGTVRLDSITLRLVRDSDGRGNWQGLAKEVPSRSPEQEFSVRRIIMQNAAVIFTDLLGKEEYYFDDLEFRTDRLESGKYTPFSLHGDFGGAGMSGAADLKGLVRVREDGGRPEVAELVLSVGLDGPFIPPGGAPLTLESPVQTSPHMALPDVRGAYLGMPFSGSLVLSWDKDWSIHGELGTGRIDLLPVLIRHFEDAFGHSKMKTLREVQLRSKIHVDEHGLSLNELAVHVDGAEASGSAYVPFSVPFQMQADLTADVVDINPYIDDFNTEVPTWVGDLQADFFQWLPLKATLRSGLFRWWDFEAADVVLGLDALGGTLNVSDVSASLAGGVFSGSASAVVRGGERPDIAFAMQSTVRGADIPLLGGMFGLEDVPAGRGDVTCSLRREPGALEYEDVVELLMRNASGKVGLSMEQAKRRGVDLGSVRGELRFSHGKTGWWTVTEGVFGSSGTRRTSTFRLEGLAAFGAPLRLTGASAEYGIYPVADAPPSLMLRGKGTVDFDNMRFEAAETEAELWGLHLTGSATGVRLDSAEWNVHGKAATRGSSPRRILASMGMDVSFAADPEAWTTLSATAEYEVNARGVFFREIKGSLDDTFVDGGLDIHGWSDPEIGVSCNLNAVNLDRYLPPRDRERKVDKTQPLPLEDFRKLRVAGLVEAQDVLWRGVKLDRMRAEFSAMDGRLELPVFEATVPHGSVSLNARVDVTGEQLRGGVHGDFSNIDMGPPVAALFGREYLLGLGAGGFRFESMGGSRAELEKRLSGEAWIRVVDGAFLRMGDQREKSKDSPEEGSNLEALAREEQKRDPYTRFRSSSASFTAADGEFVTRDYAMEASMFTAHGEGAFSIPQDSINADIVVDMAAIPDVPIRIRGKLSDPEFSVSKGKFVGNTFNSIFGIPKKGWNLLKDIKDFIF